MNATHQSTGGARMSTSTRQIGGIVVSDEDYAEYTRAVDARGGAPIHIRFGGDEEPTQIWKDETGTYMCQRGADRVPLTPYSEVASDANTEPVTESAVFFKKLMDGGMPMETALAFTNQIYRNRSHDLPVPDRIVATLLQQWRTALGVGEAHP